jgi:4-hydroxythreonine-4-phosphate dehydrogenase
MTKLAISSGDPAGIGPDICIKAFGSKKKLDYSPVIFADPDLLRERSTLLSIETDIQVYNGENEKNLSDKCLWVKPHSLTHPVRPGIPNPSYASYVMKSFTDSIRLTMIKEFDARVTGPINKEIMNEGGIPFQGHTEVLAEVSETPKVLMMLANGEFKVALATTHVPIAAVPHLITQKHLEECIRILASDLKKNWNLKNPRIKILGLNPHAGDGGYIGSEDQEIIQPVVSKLNHEGYNLIGPVSADTAFIKKYDLEKVDALLAMFHDQGLPAIKALGFGEIVNITLGLPFIRTSVDHGTAYDMAGKNQVNENSMIEAAALAAHLSSKDQNA